MPDPQQGQQPMSETMQGMPQGSDPAAQFRAYMQAMQQGQQMGPNMSHTQTPQPQPQKQDRSTTSRGQSDLQNLSKSMQGLVGQVTQKMQQRKATEEQHLFDRFANSVQGINQAKQQLQTAQEALKQNPQDQQAISQLKQAQESLQQDQTILDAMFHGPHGEKNAKTLGKGFGIDDKNAGTPERQAAIKATMKAYGVGQRGANVLSQIPQTAQPQQGQQQIKPPTGGQILQAQTTQRGQDMRAKQEQAKMLEKNGISAAYIQLRAAKQNEVAEKGSNGEWTIRPMTPEEQKVQGMAQQGKIAWTMKDGKPLAVLRNPQTNQIMPGSENPALLPPSYMMEHIHEGNYFWTDAEGNLHETPTTSTTKPGVPISTSRHTITPITPKGSQDAQGATGDRIVGKGKATSHTKELRMNFEKSYEKPAEDVEKSAQMSDYAYKEYTQAQSQGKELPTGAQSMLQLSQHLQTTFGQVKGSRVTKDMIHEHLGARSISDDALVAVQKLTNGDALSPDQWEAFHDLIQQSRKEQWELTAKEARRAKVPLDMIPQDLLKKGVGAPEGFVTGRDFPYVGSDRKTVVGWSIGGKYTPE